MRGGLSWRHFSLLYIPFLGWVLAFLATGVGIYNLVDGNLWGIGVIASAVVWLFGAVSLANRISRTLA
ncbi:MAG: hypothetical protein FJ318_10145 [SAR202 cluster bacterium]|nr:hypothetical protein [SAR202 cluster bacterium]